MIQVAHHEVSNGDGWMLSLRRTFDDAALVRERDPLLLIPGYGTNSLLFAFPPSGTSMEASLAARGFEVWSIDLRGHGRSRNDGGSTRYGLMDLVLKDLFAGVHGVLERTASTAKKVDLIGCSLGGSMAFAYLTAVEEPRVGRIVNMGGPVRWIHVHPLVRLAFRSPRLIGKIPMPSTRPFVRMAMPAIERVPGILSFYLHADSELLAHSDSLVQALESPSRHLNQDIAEWIQQRDLVIGGVNVAEKVSSIDVPLLTVVANDDGIVPRDSVLWPHMQVRSERRDLLEVGTYSIPITHADMFVSRHAPEMVFAPLADWLAS